MKKILFHICCGPCATASIKKLQSEGYEITGFYYNPNIHPASEYKKRLAEAKKLAERLGINLIIPKYNPEEYFDAIKGNEENPKLRCPKCWEIRLSETAKEARELGIGEIGTTLRISPYQDQDSLLELGKNIATQYGLKFNESELVDCFHDSIKMSKEQNMYRQKYCGCTYSREYR